LKLTLISVSFEPLIKQRYPSNKPVAKYEDLQSKQRLML